MKFNQPDVFYDNPSVPYEIVIRFSRGEKMAWSVMNILLFGLGVYLIIMGGYVGFYFWGVILILIGGGLTFVYLRDAFDNTPKITISNAGMSTAVTHFYRWAEISG